MYANTRCVNETLKTNEHDFDFLKQNNFEKRKKLFTDFPFHILKVFF
jgi:hypothetical protein